MSSALEGQVFSFLSHYGTDGRYAGQNKFPGHDSVFRDRLCAYRDEYKCPLSACFRAPKCFEDNVYLLFYAFW